LTYRRLARRPRTTGRRLGALAAELARIGIGTSTVAPSKRDRRFADPAWSGNPLLRRVVQAYLATRKTLEAEGELGGGGVGAKRRSGPSAASMGSESKGAASSAASSGAGELCGVGGGHQVLLNTAA
jgi:hypothetical protein